ncbi:VTT domain-containing protein [Demequina sp. TTPB684]|uniref:DedA family protein n=1 Tax=unclassified Demequina TaxID=2620311 RepID=UPI001CF445D8|nr:MULTISPECIES: VTT domain-containing protein [unclassified Demequina]MCB2413302.1 VTT domain-containing protein [Demequina sp. TTPB684]UPU88978.1 VTT domain-containing protein [Demequina sp. TMPB413]
MPGIPGFVEELGWWAVFLFLFCVVLLRAQGTYWLGRWARKGAETGAQSHSVRAASMARRLSGPGADKARDYLERWGFIGIPASFLTVGFQTMVNASAGFIRMRWDLYTVAMIPGCIMWAALYTGVTYSLVGAWSRSPWLLAAAVLGVAALLVAAAALTRRRRSAGSSVRTPQ